MGLKWLYKRAGRYIRSVIFFKMRYPWIERGRNVNVTWSTSVVSPNRRVRFGNNVWVGLRCVINSDLTVGNDVLIASHVGLLSRNAHRYDLVGVSMFQSIPCETGEIVIEDDVWIGFGAIILSGVRIGRGSIIAAGSVVQKDVPPYSIFAPAQGSVIRRRFTSEQIEEHERGLRQAGVLCAKLN
jgi:acetyltransferase-like isoleucine patch superfamily enzyme